ncbi:hypothetical protein FJZ33_04385 [Candidatus Poribacteria bacterium]|nr:hypothetical protein [Candidatus Poribacteria bacterium]
MIIDVHIHSRGTETAAEILKAMDKAGVDRIFLFGPYPGLDEDKQRESDDYVAKIASEAGDRIIPFAFIEPRLKSAPQEVERAVTKAGVKAVKMIPMQWYPGGPEARAVYEKINELEVPMLFHSGILWGTKDDSQYCRPVYYEALLDYPKIKFAMAHISWPWCDELLAVCGKFRAARRNQIFIDITSGAPRFWKVDALRKALIYLGDDTIVFGSDSSATGADYMRRRIDEDMSMLREEVGVTKDTIEKIFGTNAMKLFQK